MLLLPLRRCLWLLLALLSALVSADSTNPIWSRCQIDGQPAAPWRNSDTVQLREADFALQTSCQFAVRGLDANHQAQWLTLSGLGQSSVNALPSAAKQPPATLVWRTSLSAAFGIPTNGEAVVQINMQLPIGGLIRAKVETPQVFLARDSDSAQTRSALLTLLFGMGFVSAIFAIALRDSVVGWYSGFTLSIAMVWSFLTGFAIFPTELALHSPLVSRYLLLCSYSAALFFGIRFGVGFTSLKRISPLLHRVIIGIGWGVVAFTALSLMPNFYGTVINFYNLVALLALLGLITPGFESLRRGAIRNGLLFLVGWLPIILVWGGLLVLSLPHMPGYPNWLGAISTFLQRIGLLPDWLYSVHSRQFALLLQSIIFSIALADRAAAHRRLRNQAVLTDRTTQLANRASFLVTGRQQLESRVTQNRSLVVFDIDSFALINDALGYESGDAVLRETGQRLQRKLGEKVLLARVSGNQFAALLNDTANEGMLALIVSSISRLSMQFDEQAVDIRLRCGSASYPRHGQDIELLMRRAEIALLVAKTEKQAAMVYQSAMEQDHRPQLTLLSALRTAMAQNQLQLFLQPKARLSDGEIVGAEVLLRWQHPEKGMVSPLTFLPFAEKTGLIVELTRWMLVETFKLAKRWQSAGLNLRLSANLSASDLADPSLPAYVAEMLMHSRADPKLLCIEITESEIMRDPKLAVSSMRALRTLGFDLSLDDFGTGNSSLAYLQDMPVSELKIDRSFVSAAKRDKTGRQLVYAIAALSRTLGLKTVAEGVETSEEWQMVIDAGCDEVQGYLVSKPLSVSDFEVWLKLNQPFIAHAVEEIDR